LCGRPFPFNEDLLKVVFGANVPGLLGRCSALLCSLCFGH